MKNNYQRRHKNDSRNWFLADYDIKEKFNLFKEKHQNLENLRCFVLYHWFYCSATAPYVIVYSDLEEIEEYLNLGNNVKAGDIIEIFPVMETWFSYKIPDERNLIPEKGAY